MCDTEHRVTLTIPLKVKLNDSARRAENRQLLAASKQVDEAREELELTKRSLAAAVDEKNRIEERMHLLESDLAKLNHEKHILQHRDIARDRELEKYQQNEIKRQQQREEEVPERVGNGAFEDARTHGHRAT